MLIIGLWLMLLAKMSYGQDSYTPDSIEVNQIGFVVWQRYPVFVSEEDSVVTWDFILKKDTLWFDENKPIALPGNYEKQLSRKIKRER